MSRSTSRSSAAAAFGAFLLLAVAAVPVLAHADGATIQLSHEIIQPGGTISVHGQGMNPDEVITFELGDATKALPLGTAVATGDGFVDTNLEIPWQTPKGPWFVYARGTDGDVVLAPLVLAGVALDPEEGTGEPPDEEDPYIGLEPTATPDATPGPGTGARPSPTSIAALPAATFRPRTLPSQPAEAPVVSPPTPQPDPGVLIVAGSGAIVLVTLLAVALLLLRRRRRTA